MQEMSLRHRVLRYMTAFLSVALAVAVRLLLRPFLGTEVPYITLFPAIAFAAWYGGLGPALLAVALGGLAAAYYLLPPLYPFTIGNSAAQLGFAFYWVVSSIIVLLSHAQRKAQRLAEERMAQLTQERQWLQVTLSSIGDAVIATDAQGRVTFMNPTAESLTGWTLAEAKGRSLEEVFKIQNAHTGAPVENPVARVLREGRACGLANNTVLVARDGRLIPIDDSGAPIRDAGQNISGVILIFRDVTARQQAAARSGWLAAIVESSEDAIISKDLDGTITSWNQAAERTFGYTAEEVVGRPISLMIPPDHADDMSHILSRIRKGDRVDHFETVRRTKDGRLLDVSLTVSPIRDGSGHIIGASKIVRDITERRKSERERAQLLASEQSARSDAERAILQHRHIEEQLTALVKASGALLQSLRLADVLSAILGLSRQLIAADAYAVWRRDLSGGQWRVVADAGLSASYARVFSEVASPPSPGPQLEEPLIIEDVDEVPWMAHRKESYYTEGIRALLVIPLRIYGQSTATLTFYYAYPRPFANSEVRVAMALGNLAATAIGSAELHEAQSRLRVEAEETQRRATFLSEASAVLASSLDYQTTLASVARLAVPHFADWCTVEMREEDGSSRLLAVAHVDPSKVEWVKELRRRYPPYPNDTLGVPQVLRTGRSELYPEIPDALLVAVAHDPEHLRILREVGMRSLMMAPLVARGHTLGVISFVAVESGRHYSPADLVQAEDLARRAALAVDNARLYSIAQAERRRLEEANRAKDEFLATISHELRTPLTSMLGWTRMLRTNALDPETAARALDTIERNAKAQAQLIEDLLDVSRIISGKLRLQPGPVTPAPVIEAAMDALLPAAQAKGIDMERRLSPDVGPIWGDSDRLQQIVWNLLSNAVKFTPAGGRVTVRLACSESQISIIVQDTGQGIATEFLPHIRPTARLRADMAAWASAWPSSAIWSSYMGGQCRWTVRGRGRAPLSPCRSRS